MLELLDLPNFILTPHVAWASREAIQGLADQLIDNVEAFWAGSPRNVWAVTVADIDRQADRVRVRLAGEVPLVAEITPSALEELALQPGVHIWAASRPLRSPPTPPERMISRATHRSE